MRQARLPDRKGEGGRSLYRLFLWDGVSEGEESGGPLYVPRRWQGAGRHDNPDLYGAFYCSQEPVSCVAEMLQPFRNQVLGAGDLERRSGRLALGRLQLSSETPVLDLDDPQELVSCDLRPSQVATKRREATQKWAAGLFREEFAGFFWWSTLEAEWINGTLFAARVISRLELEAPPTLLTLEDPVLLRAAAHLGIRLDRD